MSLVLAQSDTNQKEMHFFPPHKLYSRVHLKIVCSSPLEFNK